MGRVINHPAVSRRRLRNPLIVGGMLFLVRIFEFKTVRIK